jgi:asparagine synthase (glutamine-hydrolysing)
MAGLYISLKPLEADVLSDVENWLRHGDEAVVGYQDEISMLWLGYENPTLYGPAKHVGSGCTLFTSGRVTIESCPDGGISGFEGGIVNQVLLDRYLKGGISGLLPVNGAVVVAIWDPRVRCLHVLTDMMGYHPIFSYRSSTFDLCRITTFPDALLHDRHLNLEPDYCSMADFLSSWRVSPPYTYYRQVEYVGAGVHCKWDLNKKEVTTSPWWKPFTDGFFSDIDGAAEELARALSDSISDRTRDLDAKTIAFISGGADSRVMLFGAHDAQTIVGINLSEYSTHETAIARQLCAQAGVEFMPWSRDPDYYPRMLLTNVRWSGAMWSSEDAHYLGVSDIVHSHRPGLVMTACTTDWLFKGYGLEKEYRTVFGRNLPLRKFANKLVGGYLPNQPRPCPPDYESAILERREAVFAGISETLNTDEERLRAEERRVRPACYTVSVSGQIMYRVYPYDTFLADPRVISCYSKTPAWMKLNGEVWGKAAVRVCRDGGSIVDSNYGWRLDASEWHKLAIFMKRWLRRRLPTATRRNCPGEGHPPSTGSWPDMGWYAKHSQTLAEFWNTRPRDERSLMTELWGSDPWLDPLESWAADPHGLFRILTLLAHWEIQRSECNYSVV